MDNNIKQYIVTNVQGTKGIIQPAKNMDEARKLATHNYYSPFTRKQDLTVTQVYEEGKHLFVTASGNKNFGFVQFHTMGGVSTSYNCNIDTKPTERQLSFLREPIDHIKFFLTRKDS